MAEGSKYEFKNVDEGSETSIDRLEQDECDEDEKEGSKSYETGEDKDLRSIENYSSIAKRVRDGTVPQNILEFYYSYAYDCRKYFNLCIADMNTVIFASGNLIHIFDVTTNRMSFRTGSMGGGIGHICKNYVSGHITVAENGLRPVITIYQWPSMEIITVLKDAAAKSYSFLAYSPDGLLLVSQGGEPDYFITIWKWEESRIMLQCRSYIQDVYNVTFSNYIPGHVTSSGSGHIKFWKISRTFTGLKLKDKIGRFGKTEISDIIAIHPMPNETVISGCEWGNILLWDEGLIKLEACRKNKHNAHPASIVQFQYINGELLSIGTDGCIRFWFYETIDHADMSDGEYFLEIEPIYEFHVVDNESEHSKETAMLMCIQKQEPDDPESTTWYAQDGNGGLWLLDLCTSGKPEVWRKIFTCHAGSIVDMAVPEWGPFVATLDETGHLHIYNYITKKLIIVHKFKDLGTQLIWLPYKIDKTGSSLICAFKSGIIRMINVAIQAAETQNNIKGDFVRLSQVLKPHTMSITVMSTNTSGSLLITGSNDCTLFVFSIRSTDGYPIILPIGYVEVPSPISCVAWKPDEVTTVLIGCLKGDCVEVRLPDIPQTYTRTSYHLVECSLATFKFQSVKSSIRREHVRQEREDERKKKLAERKKEMERLISENPQIVDEESFFAEESQEDLPLPEIYIPEPPNAVSVVQYINNETIWLLMGGFDAGYIYEYLRPLSGNTKAGELLRCERIAAAEDTEIHSFFFHKNRKYLFFGTKHGEICVCKVKPEDPMNLSDYWILPIHDYNNGYIPKMLLSYMHDMLLTCGHDGNVFSFFIQDDTPNESIEVPIVAPPMPFPQNVEDIDDADYPSLEEVLTRKEESRIAAAAKKKKSETLRIVQNLTEEYAQIMERNQNLPPSQQIVNFEMDPRITKELDQQLKQQMNFMLTKLAFKAEKSKLELQKLTEHFVTPITCLPFAVRRLLNQDGWIHSLREQSLDVDATLKELECLKNSNEAETAEVERQQKFRDNLQSLSDTILVTNQGIDKTREDAMEKEVEYLEEFSEDIGNVSPGLKIQISQLLAKYREIKARLLKRQKEWNALYARKPDLSKSYVKDVEYLEGAQRTVGEYNMKMYSTSDVTKRKHDSTLLKYQQLLHYRKKLHRLREDFNEKLKTAREKKQKLRNEVLQATETLKRIHAEIPVKSIKFLPQPPAIDLDVEFPEHNLQPGMYTSMAERVKQVKRERQSLIADQSFDPFDTEYEVLLLDQKTGCGEQLESLSTLVSFSQSRMKDKSLAQTDVLRNLNTSDSVQTPWERQMKRFRMMRKLYEQDGIISRVETMYADLEKELNELEEYRLDVVYKSVYMNLFLLTLYEELMVLKEYEATENALEEKVEQKSEEVAQLKSKMQTISVEIGTKEEEIRTIHNKIKEITSLFGSAVRENKFHDFLRKIFKKKYTTAIKKGSLESTDRSSEMSTDESETTEDSDIGNAAFNENVCPAGCEKELYEMAFAMREKRYEYEQQVKEGEKEIDLLRKQFETDRKHLRIMENNLKRNEKELQAFMLEKQQSLNNINVTIVLKFHQLQHVSDTENIPDIQDCVVFDRDKLSGLYNRIKELRQETSELEEKRRKNEAHLGRLRIDCKYMEMRNKDLEKEIKEETIRKFGRNVSLTSIYESVLRRMMYDAKADARQSADDFHRQIKAIKRSYGERLLILEELIKENTKKLSLLTVLEKEKQKLKTFDKIPLSEKEMVQEELKHKSDLEKLENILRSQLQQKELLQNDIKRLRADPRKMPPIFLNKTTF